MEERNVMCNIIEEKTDIICKEMREQKVDYMDDILVFSKLPLKNGG